MGDMSNLRPELHVAQQSRRDKLRVQYSSIQYQNSEEQFSVHQGLNPDFMQFRSYQYDNLSYDPEILNVTANSHDLLPHKDSMVVHQHSRIQSDQAEEASFFQTPLFNSSTKVRGDQLHNCSTWKCISSQQNNALDTNYTSESSRGNFKPSYSPSIYQNTLQDVVTSATHGNKGAKLSSSFPPPNISTSRGSWTDSGNELTLLTSYSDPVNRKRDSQDVTNINPSTQALSLSLSSVPQSNMVGTSTSNHRSLGPLGPFTGYATILRCSKYSRPAQQILEESFNIANTLIEETRVSKDGIIAEKSGLGAKIGGSGASSSTIYSLNEKSREPGGLSRSNESVCPEYLQKAKLLYMQEEVCRRYKQYHQQMKMVVASFESVAGLSSATPYISLALKTISRRFRCLTNAISDQIKSSRKALGEDLLSPEKGDTRLNIINDQTFKKQKAGFGSEVYFESRPIWRPQRGLPERAVAVLRAWLFEHFLHPYPTDGDKNILATQTGLTKSQVSNWFINARVRVWKPMVEEMHTLESKGWGTESGSTVLRTDDDNPSTEDVSGQHLNKIGTSGGLDGQIESSNPDSGNRLNPLNPDTWNQENRSSVDMEGSLFSFMPYQQSVNETRGQGRGPGPGPVSLTLGLTQSAEGAQPQQQHHLQHFGSHIFHDFVG